MARANICVVLWLAPSIFLGDAFSIDENEAYIKAGYTQIAPVDYEDEGQPHAWMAKRVEDSR